MIAVPMESCMSNPQDWTGPLQMELGGHLYESNFVKDDTDLFNKNIDNLYKQITRLMKDDNAAASTTTSTTASSLPVAPGPSHNQEEEEKNIPMANPPTMSYNNGNTHDTVFSNSLKELFSNALGKHSACNFEIEAEKAAEEKVKTAVTAWNKQVSDWNRTQTKVAKTVSLAVSAGAKYRTVVENDKNCRINKERKVNESVKTSNNCLNAAKNALNKGRKHTTDGSRLLAGASSTAQQLGYTSNHSQGNTIIPPSSSRNRQQAERELKTLRSTTNTENNTVSALRKAQREATNASEIFQNAIGRGGGGGVLGNHKSSLITCQRNLANYNSMLRNGTSGGGDSWLDSTLQKINSMESESNRILREHEQIETGLKNGLQRAAGVGELLRSAKSKAKNKLSQLKNVLRGAESRWALRLQQERQERERIRLEQERIERIRQERQREIRRQEQARQQALREQAQRERAQRERAQRERAARERASQQRTSNTWNQYQHDNSYDVTGVYKSRATMQSGYHKSKGGGGGGGGGGRRGCQHRNTRNWGNQHGRGKKCKDCGKELGR